MPESTALIVNLLHEYSGLNQFNHAPTNLKSKESIDALIAGLRRLYRDHGYIDAWAVRPPEQGTSIAHGNPLTGNTTVQDFRKMYAKNISGAGKAPRTAPPLSAEHIIEHTKQYLL